MLRAGALATTFVSYRQNKSPFAIALGDWFPLRTYFLTSKALPNDREIIVIVVIIIVGEAKLVLHSAGIIAQTVYLDRVFLFLEHTQPGRMEKVNPIAMLSTRYRILKLLR